MHKLLRNTAKLLALLVMSGFGLANHAAAMPSIVHNNMSGMDHNNITISSSRCATLCTSMVFNKDDETSPRYEEKDDEPALPFFRQTQLFYTHQIHKKSYTNGLMVRPPPKVPIHIHYQVFQM